MSAIDEVFAVIDAIHDTLIAPLCSVIAPIGLFLLVMLVLSRPSMCTNSKEKAYLAAQRSDLRNLVVAQEMRYGNGRGYATALSPDEYRTSTGVTLVSMTVGPRGFTAVTSYPGGTAKRCRMTYERGGQVEPTCDK